MPSPQWLSASRLEVIPQTLTSGLDWAPEDVLGKSDALSSQHLQPGSSRGPRSLLFILLDQAPVASLPAAAETKSSVREQALKQKPLMEAEGTPTETRVLVVRTFSLQQLIKRCQAI